MRIELHMIMVADDGTQQQQVITTLQREAPRAETLGLTLVESKQILQQMQQVIDGVNGRLVPARDVSAFARAMVELAADPAARDRMSAAAREHVRRHFTLDRMTAGYLALFPAADAR